MSVVVSINNNYGVKEIVVVKVEDILNKISTYHVNLINFMTGDLLVGVLCQEASKVPVTGQT